MKCRNIIISLFHPSTLALSYAEKARAHLDRKQKLSNRGSRFARLIFCAAMFFRRKYNIEVKLRKTALSLQHRYTAYTGGLQRYYVLRTNNAYNRGVKSWHKYVKWDSDICFTYISLNPNIYVADISKMFAVWVVPFNCLLIFFSSEIIIDEKIMLKYDKQYKL